MDDAVECGGWATYLSTTASSENARPYYRSAHSLDLSGMPIQQFHRLLVLPHCIQYLDSSNIHQLDVWRLSQPINLGSNRLGGTVQPIAENLRLAVRVLAFSQLGFGNCLREPLRLLLILGVLTQEGGNHGPGTVCGPVGRGKTRPVGTTDSRGKEPRAKGCPGPYSAEGGYGPGG